MTKNFWKLLRKKVHGLNSRIVPSMYRQNKKIGKLDGPHEVLCVVSSPTAKGEHSNFPILYLSSYLLRLVII